jgi:hypothetical protein
MMTMAKHVSNEKSSWEEKAKHPNPIVPEIFYALSFQLVQFQNEVLFFDATLSILEWVYNDSLQRDKDGLFYASHDCLRNGEPFFGGFTSFLGRGKENIIHEHDSSSSSSLSVEHGRFTMHAKVSHWKGKIQNKENHPKNNQLDLAVVLRDRFLSTLKEIPTEA